jgi:hypothetical protein
LAVFAFGAEVLSCIETFSVLFVCLSSWAMVLKERHSMSPIMEIMVNLFMFLLRVHLKSKFNGGSISVLKSHKVSIFSHVLPTDSDLPPHMQRQIR